MGELAGFVDCHSHVVPSGDDGVSSTAEAIVLCREAARRGTRMLFATPHVSPQLPLTAEREAEVRHSFEQVWEHAGLELRLGWELTPHRRLLGEDPWRYELEGIGSVLVEVPFAGPADLLLRVAEHVEAAGLQVVVAHPERTEAVRSDPGLGRELVERGWLLQVNGTSLTGLHGPEMEELGWRLLEDGDAAIVASDGHRATRPPYLDEAYARAEARMGEAAIGLFDGSALGLSPLRIPSHVASRGA
jgi:protein-tyrosine phosphatase